MNSFQVRHYPAMSMHAPRRRRFPPAVRVMATFNEKDDSNMASIVGVYLFVRCSTLNGVRRPVYQQEHAGATPEGLSFTLELTFVQGSIGYIYHGEDCIEKDGAAGGRPTTMWIISRDPNTEEAVVRLWSSSTNARSPTCVGLEWLAVNSAEGAIKVDDTIRVIACTDEEAAAAAAHVARTTADIGSYRDGGTDGGIDGGCGEGGGTSPRNSPQPPVQGAASGAAKVHAKKSKDKKLSSEGRRNTATAAAEEEEGEHFDDRCIPSSYPLIARKKQHSCTNCGKEGAKKRCGHCSVRYCSRECYRQDWQSGHKNSCLKDRENTGTKDSKAPNAKTAKLSFPSRFEAEFSRRPSIDISLLEFNDLSSLCFPELSAGSIVNVQLMHGDIEFESDFARDPTQYDVAVVLERLCRTIYGKNVNKCPIVCDSYGADGPWDERIVFAA